MEQILTRPFHDPDGSDYDYNLGPDAGEVTLADFDNVDDFHDYAELQGQVKDAAGVVFSDPAYAPYSRDVSCDYVRVPQEDDVGEWTFIRITVRVCYNGKELVAVNRLVCE
jgi:hypothetical protein